MDTTEERLESQTGTWRQRLDDALEEAAPVNHRGEVFLENVRAYRSDADHFEDEGDLVRAFEAVVWAWAWLEIGARIEAIEWEYPEDGYSSPDDAV